MLGVLAAVLAGVLVLFGFGQALGARGHAQRAADLAAVSAAQVMRRNFARALRAGRSSRAACPTRATCRAPPTSRWPGRPRCVAPGATACRRGAVEVAFHESGFAPTRVTVAVRDQRRREAARPTAAIARRGARPRHGRDRRRRRRPRACPGRPAAAATPGRSPTGRASRCAPTSPPPSIAWRRRRAREAGLSLLVTSRLPLRRRAGRACSPPTPTRSGWRRRARACTATAPSSTSGRPAAYGWLAANARRFGFIQRYSWEAWHFGYTLNPGSASVGFGRAASAGGGDAAARSSRPPTATRSPARPALERRRRRCWRRSCTSSRASTRSRAAPPAPRASPSSCPARPPRSGSPTPSTRPPRSTPRRT